MCILTQLLSGVLQIGLTTAREPARVAELQPLLIMLSVLSIAVGLASMVFVFLPATSVYNVATGVALGILAVIPCLGLIVLLIVNGKATSILRQNGVRVGLLGADASQL